MPFAGACTSPSGLWIVAMPDTCCCSKNIADVLEQLEQWRANLSDLGVHEVKHDVRVHLNNLCKDGAGKPASSSGE